MGIKDKIDGSLSKSRRFKDKMTSHYREHIGEELVKKEKALNDFRKTLEEREKLVLEREKNLKKYYLIPRIYIRLPLTLLILATIFLTYHLYSSKRQIADSALAEDTDLHNYEEKNRNVGTCFDRGIEYYIEIGSYPYLSNGKSAEEQVREMCNRSNMAFQH